jgi:hypothetical protein
MYPTVSVPVPVIVILDAEALTTFTAAADVPSVPVHTKLELLVKAGEKPVIVAVPLLRVTVP